MKSELAKGEKYPIIEPKSMTCSQSAEQVYVRTFLFFSLSWLLFSALANFEVGWQLISVAVLAVYHKIRNGPDSQQYMRSELELKAKGLDIKDRYFTAIVPWEWLSKMEIRQRAFSFIPNYVYFQFKNRADVLILWEDVRDYMDSTTLVSCVRTWAPHANIVGDAKLAKSESIATYTELWLKDMNTSKVERRLRQDQALSEGTVLSDSYRVERILSGGGQGTAYLASVLPHAAVPNMPPQVVIKELILPANDRGLKKATDSLLKEVAILRRISHPLIVRLYDFFIEDMRGYLAIQFVDGVTLRQLVAQSGPLAEARVAQFGISLCDALSYLHELTPPIIHGDVTPDNVMLEKIGGIKLVDFDASQELTRNKTNTVVGKHSYMSPEQFKGELGEPSDIYGLGCTLHFLLTGVDPEPISESRPAEVNSAVSATMNQIVSLATKFDRAGRFSSLDEMRVQLERL
jgi:serine/threonine-protein kinase